MLKGHYFTLYHLATILWILFALFLNDEISVGLVRMIFKFVKVDKGELTIGRQNNTSIMSG